MNSNTTNIVAIEQITPEEQIELDKLNEEFKHRELTDEEANRRLFLGMKCLWNCEC